MEQFEGRHAKQAELFEAATDSAFMVKKPGERVLVYFCSRDGKIPYQLGIIRPTAFYANLKKSRMISGYSPYYRCALSADLETTDMMMLHHGFKETVEFYFRQFGLVVHTLELTAHRDNKLSWHYHFVITPEEDNMCALVFDWVQEVNIWRDFLARYSHFSQLLDMQCGHLKKNNGRIRAALTSKQTVPGSLLLPTPRSALPVWVSLMNVLPTGEFTTIPARCKMTIPEIWTPAPSALSPTFTVPPLFEYVFGSGIENTRPFPQSSTACYLARPGGIGSVCCITGAVHQHNRQMVTISKDKLGIMCLHPNCHKEPMRWPFIVRRLAATEPLRYTEKLNWMDPFFQNLADVANSNSQQEEVVFIQSGMSTGKSTIMMRLMRRGASTRRYLYMVTRIAEGEDIHMRLQQRGVPCYFYRSDPNFTTDFLDNTAYGVFIMTPNQILRRVGFTNVPLFDVVVIDEFSTFIETLVTASTIKEPKHTAGLFVDICRNAGLVIGLDAAIMDGYASYFMGECGFDKYRGFINMTIPGKPEAIIMFSLRDTIDRIVAGLGNDKKIAVAVTSRNLFGAIKQLLDMAVPDVRSLYMQAGDTFERAQLAGVQLWVYTPVITSGVDINMAEMGMTPFDEVVLIYRDCKPFQGPNILSAIQMMGRVRDCNKLIICCPSASLRKLDVDNLHCLADKDQFVRKYMEQILAFVKGIPMLVYTEEGFELTLEKTHLIPFWQTIWMLYSMPLPWMLYGELMHRGYDVDIRDICAKDDIGIDADVNVMIQELRDSQISQISDSFVDTSLIQQTQMMKFLEIDPNLEEHHAFLGEAYTRAFEVDSAEICKKRLLMFMMIFGDATRMHVSNERQIMFYDIQKVVDIMEFGTRYILSGENVCDFYREWMEQEFDWFAFIVITGLKKAPYSKPGTKRVYWKLVARWIQHAFMSVCSLKVDFTFTRGQAGKFPLSFDDESLDTMLHISNHLKDKYITLY